MKNENDEKKPEMNQDDESGASEECRPDEERLELEQMIAQKNEEILKKDAEIKDLTDKYLRTMADFQNHKKRLDRDKQDSIKFANERLITELLDVVDNLERAISHSNADTNITTLLEGLNYTRKQFLDTLKRFDVVPIETEGRVFNPELHEALMQTEEEGKGDNEISRELVKGYILKDRVIRHAKVAVNIKKKNNGEKTNE